MKRIIVAYANNRVIGMNGELPWQGQLPADMQHFRKSTLGHTIVMGRKTFESIGKPLPKRQNIIVSRHVLDVQEALTAPDLRTAYGYAIDDDIFVIGGGQVYAEALDDMDEIYATEIDADFEGDAFFPPLDKSIWVETSRQDFLPDAKNQYGYSFVTYANTTRQ